jgi:hypothetical protein
MKYSNHIFKKSSRSIRVIKKIIVLISSALVALITLLPVHTEAQGLPEDLSLSFGVGGGLAPQFTLGDSNDSGTAFMAFGELQYKQIIGQLSFTTVVGESIGNFYTLDNAYAFHGSLGYSIRVTERIEVPVMATLGGMTIQYTTAPVFGSTGGLSFSDGNVQVGATLAPRFSITDQLSIFASLRYMQGIVTADESEQIDLMKAAAGVRFTLF